ncbi:MAG: primosomal protein N' [Gammaproteobacteria bacterium]|nr:primosomal protein N' [Gammaproteobacteria bacterium]
MNQIVQVAVPRPVWQVYDYQIPKSDGKPVVGGRVRVPFGHSVAIGVVTSLQSKSEFASKLKTVDRVLDQRELLSPDLVRLAFWMANYYHYPIGLVIDTMLPTEALRGRKTNLVPQKRYSTEPHEEPPVFKNANRQAELWNLLESNKTLTDSELRELRVEKTVLSALLRKKLVRWEYVEKNYEYKPAEFNLSDEQRHAVDSITGRLDSFGVHVLDGVTGSGKTEVYIQAIRQVLEQGKQVLVLVPEISLTPQTSETFRSRFGNVAVLHSMKTNVQRFDVWCRIGSGEHRIVIGTRSAIFAPFKDLGLIVVDEEHDTSYKQDDSLRYSARDMAVVRANLLQIPCVLGSATPSLETLHNVDRKQYSLCKLSHRPGTAEMPRFNVLDIRGHTLEAGLSPILIAKIKEHLDAHAQVLILINRRGYARTLFCPDCGWKARCSDCEVNLTLHEFPRSELRCHHCERRYRVEESCPNCDSARVRSFGAATQRIEESIGSIFKEVPIYRVDSDSTRTSNKLERLFKALRTQTRCILVGTQMLAKGHHLPNVTLVAVVDADAGFLSSDFRAPERVAQLIVQVAGRAGRAERTGEVWIQSFDPFNPLLQALIRNGYDGFVESEQVERRMASMPPSTHLALLRAEGSNAEIQEKFLRDLLGEISSPHIEIFGPVPAPIERVAKRWRYQAAVISNSRTALHTALRTVEKTSPPQGQIRWSIDVDPSGIS